ncbi:hypothetical protein L6452_08389 [Arctium lappa]|uniref:Uncharacterized protein n=1 Tax=Arctium lappa TaxID=4217 RepID=A0ACB9DH40_ARCLA|nr:hypothetical protein L6452_08389 [Arctium lappa]
MGDKVVLPCLKFIDLSNSLRLKRLPDVSWAPNVERLVLSYCFSLVEVHESLGSLKRLVYLDMGGCNRLRCLPSRIEMESLETLNISYCRSLETFPEVSPCMVKLSEINVFGCGTNLENNIPNSIREFCTSFPKLRRLYPLYLPKLRSFKKRSPPNKECYSKTKNRKF